MTQYEGKIQMVLLWEKPLKFKKRNTNQWLVHL